MTFLEVMSVVFAVAGGLVGLVTSVIDYYVVALIHHLLNIDISSLEHIFSKK